MTDHDWLAERFEEHRGYLRAVAYRMLGSFVEADDALQEVWLRLSRTDTSEVEHMRAWLTTVVGRVCLNMLRSRERRREEPLVRVPDPIVTTGAAADPAEEMLLADSVGLALLVVIETLTPAERLAFVLHDIFAVPFEEIAWILDRSPAATRQLASRARHRVQGEAQVPDVDLAAQREIVEAFFAAARDGDFDRLVALLDPEVVLRVDAGLMHRQASRIVRGATAVAKGSLAGVRRGLTLQPAVINGTPGGILFEGEKVVTVMGFTVVGGRIVEVDALLDPERLEQLDLRSMSQ